ncbi:tRNA pseudouridine(55) synthase TruB [Portibacter marinus]|uniref:tRNA pseudouridine(55) synthase TruB n=1 Tax=Portibacter marinus TaxID=2898660 RepID=UPI001F1BEBE9|nr:tRNA pseudouridine(55) synthase TruB [Portibacter marinus]
MISHAENIAETDFLEGSLLLVDKPLTWTSFDVVNKIRYTLKHALGVKKIKVGHAGTLDPLATGLLLICTGRYTKKINELTDLDKTYTGTLKLGATTLSYDGEMDEEEHFETHHINQEMIQQTAEQFIGEIEQYPPVYSAIKIDGVPSHRRVRSGEEVKMKSRPVIIHDFVINDVRMPFVDFEVKCSKGTYIRTLAHDFGLKLENGAYLTALRRTKTAGYNVKFAWNLDHLIKEIKDVHRN